MDIKLCLVPRGAGLSSRNFERDAILRKFLKSRNVRCIFFFCPPSWDCKGSGLKITIQICKKSVKVFSI